MTRAEFLAAWERAILAAPPPWSWAKRSAEVSAVLTTESLGHMLVAAQDMRDSVRHALEDRLRSLGVRGRTFVAGCEVRTGCAWFIDTPWGYDTGGRERLNWCGAGGFSEQARDWYTDSLDEGAHESDRAQDIGDDLTVVLTDDGGVVMVTTSMRIAPRRLL